jgi:hypothetical protein
LLHWSFCFASLVDHLRVEADAGGDGDGDGDGEVDRLALGLDPSHVDPADPAR